MHQSAPGLTRGVLCLHSFFFCLQYNSFAGSISDIMGYYMSNMHSATRNLAQTISITAQVQNQTFPYVTIGAFETLARHATQQSGIETFVYSPLVSNDQRATWEAYSVANQGWVAMSQSQLVPSDGTELDSDYTKAAQQSIAPFIWSTLGSNEERTPEPPNSGPYLPSWMARPIPESGVLYVNANRFSAPSLDEQNYFVAGIAKGACCDCACVSENEVRE